MSTDEIMALADAYSTHRMIDGANDIDASRQSINARAALFKAVESIAADAARGRYMIDNGCWHRGDEQTHLSVLVPQGSDLSCVATRRAAIDAAMKGETP